ncbi:YeeE/YedE family protein [Maricaulis sp.]|uniref:YeeE/YedE family protein n=1 Tax=Maricaulis sp. TaxID=1486257 RepID=UPI0025C21BB7|nr:YeeE/YedE family protein [Maricaulis sp.]
MENFTPVSALAGGALIGLSAVLLMALNGRIAGISGLLGTALFGAPGDRAWRLFFLGGMVLAPLVMLLVPGEARPSLAVDITSSWPLLIIGGLLVGFGTRLGSGCTSGHGVCGLSRLSARSLIAVLVFMAVGMVTVTVMRGSLASLIAGGAS